MWDNMFKSVDMLQKGMNAAWTRNAVIRNNMANVETPGFKASDVAFESLLLEALEEADDTGGFVGARTHEKHIEIGSRKRQEQAKQSVEDVEATLIKRENLSMRADGNDVDIESENAKLAQNSIYYNTLVSKLNSELRRLKTAISEGR